MAPFAHSWLLTAQNEPLSLGLRSAFSSPLSQGYRVFLPVLTPAPLLLRMGPLWEVQETLFSIGG